MPQPVRRKTLAVSVQDWLGEQMDGDRPQGPQLVVNRCGTAPQRPASTIDESAVDNPVRDRLTQAVIDDDAQQSCDQNVVTWQEPVVGDAPRFSHPNCTCPRERPTNRDFGVAVDRRSAP